MSLLTLEVELDQGRVTAKGGEPLPQHARALLTILPALVLMMTSFTRIIIVLSILRHALGLQQTPPNQVLVGLSLFLSLFVMQPVLNGWPGEAAPSSKGHATSLFLLAWYSGAAAVGVLGGHAYAQAGWPGVVGMVLAMSAAATAALWLPGGGLVRR